MGEMFSIWLCFEGLFIIGITHLVYKWRNPKCRGRLPPGSMGMPLIGETFQFFTHGNSLDLPPFLKKGMEKYGSLFKTSVAGRPVVISSDPEFNYFIINQEGKLVQKWYMDSLSKTTDRGEFPTTVSADKITKYLRNLVLKHFGPETLKQKLLPPVEEMVRRHLRLWSTKESVEVQLSLLSMVFDLTAKLLFNYETDITQLSESYVSQLFTNFSEIMMCFPLNIPGTALYRALKNKEKAVNMLKGILEERRRAIPNRSHGDILDHVIQDMRDETFLSDNFVATTMFSILSANIEPIATSIALAIILLTDHPSVLQELRSFTG